MDQDTIKRIAEIAEELKRLPRGNISRKVIKGHVYYYHQYSGKTVYLSESELSKLSVKLQRRKYLKEELKSLKMKGPTEKEESQDAEYVLMHLNDPVADLQFDRHSGLLLSLGTIYDPSLIPVRAVKCHGSDLLHQLQDWWASRCIPMGRDGIEDVLEQLHLSSPSSLILQSNGLSLTDTYWIKPHGSPLSWDNVNLYHNPFDEGFGKILFGEGNGVPHSFLSPDLTTSGKRKKRWQRLDGKLCLVKGGTAPCYQEPFNEVMAATIANVLEFKHVDYRLYIIDGFPYSVCPDFIDDKQDFVSAADLLAAETRKPNESLYDQLVRVAAAQGIPNIRRALSEMIILDYLIANQQRRLDDFGFLRDAKTLKWIGFAPLFGHESSFGYNMLTRDIAINKSIVSKPFDKDSIAQLKRAYPYPTINEKTLDIVPFLMRRYLEEHGGPSIDKERASAIAQGLSLRIRSLKSFLKK